MNSELLTPSPATRTFRDPAGSVELRPDGAYRFVRPAFEAELLEFVTSPLAARLVAEGKLVSSEVVAPAAPGMLGAADEEPAPLVLRHPLVWFPSFPWEWSPALLLVAAELTLELSRELLAEGWILKDATPLNVLFQGVEPIFVDVLSVARLEPTQPIWYAYSQFVRTFLLPMIANAQLGWPLRTMLTRRDGYEPEELFPMLSLASRLHGPVLSAVTLPSMLGSLAKGKGAQSTERATARRSSDPELVKHVLGQTFARLQKQMRRALPTARSSKWSAYTRTAVHYSEADRAAKLTFVANALQRSKPKRVLDVGCNAGVYSDLAVDAGAEVVAVDTDQQTVDRLCTRLKGSGRPILPLVVDLANPTPGVGWRNRESASFLQRAQGRFDGLLMLAVIHHLLLHDHVPLPEVAELCASLTTGMLIIEWVPSGDAMFRELVRGRDEIFSGLTQEAFEECFGQFFVEHARQRLENGRTLFHLERRPNG